jgi:hypothetical protein
MFKDWKLQDWANLAQILSLLGLPLSVALWYFTRGHFGKFWLKWRKPTFYTLGVAASCGAAWRLGWLGWFTHPVTLPVWLLAAICVSAFGASKLVALSFRSGRSMRGATSNTEPLQPKAPRQGVEPPPRTPPQTETTSEGKRLTAAAQPLVTREPDEVRFPPFWSPLLQHLQAHEPYIHVYLKEAKAVRLSRSTMGETLTVIFPFKRREHDDVLLKLKHSTIIQDILLNLGYGGLHPRIEFAVSPKQ